MAFLTAVVVAIAAPAAAQGLTGGALGPAAQPKIATHAPAPTLEPGRGEDAPGVDPALVDAVAAGDVRTVIALGAPPSKALAAALNGPRSPMFDTFVRELDEFPGELVYVSTEMGAGLGVVAKGRLTSSFTVPAWGPAPPGAWEYGAPPPEAKPGPA